MGSLGLIIPTVEPKSRENIAGLFTGVERERCRDVHGSGQTSRVGSRVGSNLAGRVGSGRVRMTRPDPSEFENLQVRKQLLYICLLLDDLLYNSLSRSVRD